MVTDFRDGISDAVTDSEAGAMAVDLECRTPEEVIGWTLRRFRPERVAISTSFQADGMAIIDMAWRHCPDIRVVTVDTGRLPAETYDLIERVRERYNVSVEVSYPDATELAGFVGKEGINAFYREVSLRLRCCAIRKVNPLNKVLGNLDAWITGLRRDQWASRAKILKVEIDHGHGGLLKVNPLADWTDDDVWRYIRAYDVPYNKLYDQGYTSIGCAPCTRPTGKGEDPRVGRWWWETDVPKECGIHYSIETGRFERKT